METFPSSERAANASLAAFCCEMEFFRNREESHGQTALFPGDMFPPFLLRSVISFNSRLAIRSERVLLSNVPSPPASFPIKSFSLRNSI